MTHVTRHYLTFTCKLSRAIVYHRLSKLTRKTRQNIPP